MTKPMRSTKAPARKRPKASGRTGPAVAKGDTTASRQQVRQEIHRTQVPRQSQRPGERSNQRRSKKP